MTGDASFVLIATLTVVLWIWLVADVRRRVDLTRERKAIWIGAALLFPVAATLVYLLRRPRRPV